MQPKRRYRRRQDRESRKHVKPAGEAAGIVLDPADHGGAEETAEIAERVYPGDAGSCGGAGQEHGWHRPEWALRTVKPDRGNRHAHHGPWRARELPGNHEAEPRDQ